ncbi:mycofactocin-coupled SDR family oxidoreductase [Rhodococcus sp. NPDC056743]|uniref:mycofactocin-coupled SDR family oxidoreductase n=1 Tax=Rhodococcus sp. NPDC056743 TaxID=3345934 RepID=UPI0036704101
MMRRFADKVVLVTGAARGQGRAEAIRFAQEGASIIAIDLCADLRTTTYPGATKADLEQTARAIEAEGGRVVTAVADVRDFTALSQATREGVEQLGRLDVVVANAGMTTAARSWEITAEQWQETIEINLTGVFHTAKATIPILIDQGGGGSIVMISSVAGLRGLPLLSHYSAAKHGVVGLCRAMANELASYDIRVNSVHPFGVDTNLKVGELFDLLEEEPHLGISFAPTLPYSKSDPEDIANAVAWIASDEARHVTGIQLPVDLGVITR